MSRSNDVFKRNKWAMAGYKRGKCCKCGLRFTEENSHKFAFHHLDQVNNGHDKSDRWGGAIRGWAPFTDKWYEWADSVEMLCEDCHRDIHRKQFTLLDDGAQARMDQFIIDPFPAIQLDML